MGKYTESQEENSSTPLGCENGVRAPGYNVGYNVVATGKCDASKSSTRLVSTVEPATAVKVTINEEKTSDEMIEISIDLPPSPKIHEPTTSYKEKSERTNEKLLYQQLKSELRSLEEDLARKEAEIEQLKNDHKKNISVTKKKQWCYVCGLEAKMYCCWNTSYCAVGCQALHWGQDHKNRCQRIRTSTGHEMAGS